MVHFMKLNLDDANKILSKYVHERYLLDHSLESAAVMKGLAKHFSEDEQIWQIAGLLHDLDWETTAKNPKEHGTKACEYLTIEGIDNNDLFNAIKSHNSTYTGIERKSKLDFALSAAENTVGLIYAYLLIKPDHKLDDVKVKSIMKKYKNKAFAANVNREAISDIEKAGLTLEEFFQIALDSINSILSQIQIKI